MESGTAAPGTRLDRDTVETFEQAHARRERAMADLAEIELDHLRGTATPAIPPSGDMLSEDEWLEEVFTYHPADDGDVVAYHAIRQAAKHLVIAIKLNTSRCADQTAAIRKVREAVMTANAARALKGLV